MVYSLFVCSVIHSYVIQCIVSCASYIYHNPVYCTVSYIQHTPVYNRQHGTHTLHQSTCYCTAGRICHNPVCLMLHSSLHLLFSSPCGLSFTWWGCCGLYFWHKPAELAHSFLFSSCVYFCLYGPSNCFPFHKFSQHLSAFSLCSSGLISALLVLSTIYISLWKSPSALI